MASSLGISILVPEIQLLYKAKQTRPKDHADFELTLPRLRGSATTTMACDSTARLLSPNTPGSKRSKKRRAIFNLDSKRFLMYKFHAFYFDQASADGCLSRRRNEVYESILRDGRSPCVGSRVICPQASAQTTQQAYIWRNVKVGAADSFPGIVFSRVEKGLVYLRSDMGGCYRWDDSQKQWIPLQDPMAESSYFGGESIAPDPIDANTVYVAAGMYRSDPSAMLRSHDRGKTWDVFPVSFRMGGNEDGRGVGERLAIDPNDTSILFFGSRNDGLWRSTDSARDVDESRRFSHPRPWNAGRWAAVEYRIEFCGI